MKLSLACRNCLRRWFTFGAPPTRCTFCGAPEVEVR